MSKHSAAIVASAVSVASSILLAARRPTVFGLRLPRWALAAVAAIALAIAANESVGKPVMFLRWSYVRFLVGLRHMGATWQVGDGREQALADYVCAHARKDDIDDVIRAIDEFCYTKSYLINIGDEKGRILDRAVAAARPRRLLELGTYCGYSALRMARVMPADAVLYSIEFNAANAAVARRIWDHAGVGERIVVIVGTLGDDGKTLDVLCNEHEFSPGTVDFAFLDHEKDEYLPDLRRILDQGWLHPGSVVVADNVKYPGAPEYREFMRRHEGTRWKTREHRTHAEYQKVLKDLVLESTYLG
ncbi:Predicted O-methyltransferase [Nocardia africana]|uniref:Predicted O-methyltransferase n=2 Tax=Nocardia africana TaxID=134964 RepID=A0A378X3E2_9NOCA|nr:Predicted O-methyltransferase [Nocardia africana]